MSTAKQFDRIVAAVVGVCLLLTVLFMNGAALGLQTSSAPRGYESRLFDTTRVHTIDLVINDWDGFLETCTDEEYAACAAVIDGESYKNVAIRGKGNTSLSSVRSMDSERYSFKLEFDHYETGKSYHGLDKLSLNNVIQDNTYMKDYLTYRMMAEFGVNAPLCSFVYITVNGEDWGLYLAVEGVEDSFLERNYGSNAGELYKPDSMGFGGGGPGNGRNFNMDDFLTSGDDADASERSVPGGGNAPDFGGNAPDFGGQMPDFGGSAPNFGDASSSDASSDASSDGTARRRGGFDARGFDFNGAFGGMGSSDVKLQYVDDDPDSYSAIFGNAKTDVSKEDQKRLIASLKTLSEGGAPESVLDTEQVLRYFVVHNYVCNGDSYTGSMIHNYYLHEQDGRLSMIPWDYNLAFGTFQGADATGAVNDPIDTPLSADDASDRPMWGWIVSDEAYTAQYHALFAEFLDTVDAQAIIDEAYALIAPYVEKDPTAFCTYEEFRTGVDTLKRFCALRTQSVRGQLDGTIPSTDEGQSADASARIDADGLTLSDMGTMGGGRGGPGGSNNGNGGFGGNGGFSRPQRGEAAQTDGAGSDGSVGGASPDGSAGGAGSDGSAGGAGSDGSAGGAGSDGSVGGAGSDGSAGGDGWPAPPGFSPDGESGDSRPSPGERPNGFPGAPGGMPDFGSGGAQTPSVTRSDWIVTAVCAAALLLGVVFAKKYRIVK